MRVCAGREDAHDGNRLDICRGDAHEPDMIIRVNGEEKDVPAGTTIIGLLATLGVPAEGRAVAVNLTFVPKSRHASHELAAGDEIEIVAPMQGG